MWTSVAVLKPTTWGFTVLLFVAIAGGLCYMTSFRLSAAQFKTMIPQDGDRDDDRIKKLLIYKNSGNGTSYSLSFMNNKNSANVWNAIMKTSRQFLQAKVLITFLIDPKHLDRENSKPKTVHSVIGFPSFVRAPSSDEQGKTKQEAIHSVNAFPSVSAAPAATGTSSLHVGQPPRHRQEVTTSKLIKTLTTVTRATTTSSPNIQTSILIKQMTVSSTTKKTSCTDIQTAEDFQNRHYICDHDTGRLGNQMYSYASGYGIAMDNNMTMALVKGRLLNQFFKLDVVNVDNCACNTIKVWDAEKCCSYSEVSLTLNSTSNYKVGRYLQSWKYFRNHTKAIKKQYKFNKAITEKSQALLRNITQSYRKRNPEISPENLTIVGVHVRQGDMLSNKKYIKAGFSIAPKSYISKAMAYYSGKFSTVIFVMCSDSIDWVKSNFKGSNIFYITGLSPGIDMSVLASCNHSIMTVGSFGWWGSFLADGDTIYYKHPITEGSPLRTSFSTDYADYFYPGWIGMD